MGNRIVIDDGLKTYDIVNKQGEVLGQFSFNPSDTNIVHRYEKIYTELSALEPSESGDSLEALKELERVAQEKIDYLLGAKVSENFFAIAGAFSPLESGKYYIESVLDAIAQAIMAETGERVKKINKKVQKHTGKYHG